MRWLETLLTSLTAIQVSQIYPQPDHKGYTDAIEIRPSASDTSTDRVLQTRPTEFELEFVLSDHYECVAWNRLCADFLLYSDPHAERSDEEEFILERKPAKLITEQFSTSEGVKWKGHGVSISEWGAKSLLRACKIVIERMDEGDKWIIQDLHTKSLTGKPKAMGLEIGTLSGTTASKVHHHISKMASEASHWGNSLYQMNWAIFVHISYTLEYWLSIYWYCSQIMG